MTEQNVLDGVKSILRDVQNDALDHRLQLRKMNLELAALRKSIWILTVAMIIGWVAFALVIR